MLIVLSIILGVHLLLLTTGCLWCCCCCFCGRCCQRSFPIFARSESPLAKSSSIKLTQNCYSSWVIITHNSFTIDHFVSFPQCNTTRTWFPLPVPSEASNPVSLGTCTLASSTSSRIPRRNTVEAILWRRLPSYRSWPVQTSAPLAALVITLPRQLHRRQPIDHQWCILVIELLINDTSPNLFHKGRFSLACG